MRLAIGRLSGPGQISDWPGQLVEVIGQSGRQERYGKIHAGAGKRTDGACGQNHCAGLGQGGHGGRLGPQQPVGAPVNVREAGQPVRLPGPVHRIGIGEPVCRRPNTEVWIHCDERDGGGSERGNRLGSHEQPGAELYNYTK